ncbi:MAG: cyclic nucleotide-binding domain-containing protein [Deltaproteobacteria bacterium]|nr:cyclic nucleotide-binding domain-containing protein [Deltaproteobacteria bacterium]
MAGGLTAGGLFELLRPDQINKISEASERVKYHAGDIVYKRGEPAEHFFILLSGQVALRLPGKAGVSVMISELIKGAMFGSPLSLTRDSYALTAQCTDDAELLKIKSAVLKDLMDKDLVMGYATQSRISAIYFERYIDTMSKLQAVVMNIPIESD